ncbi:MAG: RNA polymerase sigma factor SigJ [Candidatus Limnocylindria bacterium]
MGRTPPTVRRGNLVQEFERHRSHLRTVADRMLGSVMEADDAVQEAWIRLDRSDPGGDRDLRGWLTVVVGRICLDVLRSSRARRETHAGSWLPEPIVEPMGEPGPEQQAVMADSVGLAMLVVLEELSPPERLAFVLHDVFGVPFDEISRVVDRSPAAARQLASRARRRVRGSAMAPDADLPTQRRLVEAFLVASRSGSFDALLEVLAPDAVFRIDVGDDPRFARPPVVGAEAVAREILDAGRPFAPLARLAMVNGAVGAVAGPPGRRPVGVAAFTIAGNRIVAIDLVADRTKLSLALGLV